MTTDERAPWWHGTRGEWWVVGQIAMIALVFFGPRRAAAIPDWPLHWSAITTPLGAFFMFAGALLLIAGGMRLRENLTPLPRPKSDGSLVERGVFRLVRHPMYSGGIVASYGWAIFVESWLTAGYATLLLLFLDRKSAKEERWLTEKYPRYAEYRRRVKKLIPFVY